MMDEDDEDPRNTEAQTEELHDEKTYYTVSASVKTSSKNIGPYSDVLVADYSGTAETNRNERRKDDDDDDDVREKERERWRKRRNRRKPG